MRNNYQSEIDDFYKNFSYLKESRIVLYGIGRMTMTLLEGLKGYNIVGLLDRDPSNVNKVINGHRIIDLNEIEKKADVIIINTSATYWETIAERLKNIKIPIYYRNGQRVETRSIRNYEDNKYWETNEEKLIKKIDECDVVACDFYDTLFMRRTFLAEDVFKIIEKIIKKEFGYENYLSIRKLAVAQLDETYSLDELYKEIGCLTKWKENDIKRIKELELIVEEKVLVPRKNIVDALRNAIIKGKDVYIVSDMYLPYSFYERALTSQEINIDHSHIRISCERKKTKKSGYLWEELFEEIQTSKVLCIGDDIDNDINSPKILNNNIEVFYVASAHQLLKWSSINTIESKTISMEADLHIGLICNRLFNNPFAINQNRGKIFIETPEDMGYIVFGPILLEFMRWIEDISRKDDVNELIFMSRDGFFMKPCYEEYIKYKTGGIRTKYIGISRQLAMIASIDSEDDLLDVISIPYSGTAKELLEDRFGVIVDAKDELTIEDLRASIRSHNVLNDEIWFRIHEIQENYKNYLSKMEISDNAAVIDIGYYGNNQKYLNTITRKNLKGYYMVANLDESNINTKIQDMKACFQTTEDTKALKSSLFNKLLFIESFLTAPYGMVEEIDSDGNFKCKREGNNQKYFDTKQKIFDGVQKFIHESENDLSENDTEFCNSWYDICFSKCIDYSEQIKRSFNNDNAFMNRFDNSIFV